MGLLDKIKGLLGGNKKAVTDAVDKVADVVESKTPDSIDDKVEMAAEKVKDVIENGTVAPYGGSVVRQRSIAAT